MRLAKHRHPGRAAAALSLGRVLVCALVMFVGIACKRDDMASQPRYEPFEPSATFPDGTSARPLVEGTVPRRSPITAVSTGFGQPSAAASATEFPFAIGIKDLERGRERYDIYCSACHGRTGEGDGMIVQRGLTPPPSMHIDRLRDAPVGHYYNVITNGFGAMYSYASRVEPDDRWRITAYIRALQLSRSPQPQDLNDTDRRMIDEARQSRAAQAASRVAADTATTSPAAPTTQPQGSRS